MSKRVVAIDDSDVALMVIREALDGLDVDLFATDKPGEFFRKVFDPECKPDLIITDLEMPNIAGSDICPGVNCQFPASAMINKPCRSAQFNSSVETG